MEEVEIGEIEHFFGHISVATIKLTDALKVGEKIHIKGHTTDFEQVVESMQVDHKDVNEAKSGDPIGTKIKDRVRPGDKVFKVTAE